MGIDINDVHTYEKIASVNPYDSVTIEDADIFTKVAAGVEPTSTMRKAMDSPFLRTALDAAGIAGLIGMGSTLASTGYNAVRDRIKSHNAYKQMFNEFPELQDVPRQQVDKYWQVIDDFAPKLTTNPLVAGQMISNMINYGMRGVDHNTVGQMVSISKDIDTMNNPRQLQDFSSKVTLQAMQSPYIMGDERI